MFDIGAGDGRFLTTCAKMTGASCIGIEINTDRVEEALQVSDNTLLIKTIVCYSSLYSYYANCFFVQRIQEEGVEDKCTMIAGNALEQDYSTATVFYLYLIPRGLRIILPVLKALGKKLRVITYMAPLPESEIPLETFQVNSIKHPDAQWPLFLYEIEPDNEQELIVEGLKPMTEEEMNIESSALSASPESLTETVENEKSSDEKAEASRTIFECGHK